MKIQRTVLTKKNGWMISSGFFLISYAAILWVVLMA
jgi:hypothetical protein